MYPAIDKTTKIEDIQDPEIFLALKSMCTALVGEWQAEVWSDDITEAEYKLAVAKSKQYKDDVHKLADLDSDLEWGCEKIKTGDKSWRSSKTGDFNPWYRGSAKLNGLLDSLSELVVFTAGGSPSTAELSYHYYFLCHRVTGRFPVVATTSIKFYSLNPKIGKACKSLFNSGNYASAVLEAYKVVFQEIKTVTGIRNLDGKKLAEKALSIENPIIKLNKLETESDLDEQKGFMLLLSGAAVGIRNPKAHDIVVLDDKLKALKYLSFADLLLERIEDRLT